jgi:dissimilatory sulfite reductase (desulfoviridin) alpha/beta subunit
LTGRDLFAAQNLVEACVLFAHVKELSDSRISSQVRVEKFDTAAVREGSIVAKNFELRNGTLFVLAEAAGGVYNGEQLRKISEVAEEDSAILKLTEDQRIGFMLAPERLPHAQRLLAASGLTLRQYRSGGPASPCACLGELCPSAQQDALGDSMEVAAALYAKFPDVEGYLSIGMNGCDQNCLSSGVYDIHIVGESTGYKIYIGGRAREISQVGTFLTENVAREDLPNVLQRVVEVYYANREENETLSDVTERVGFGVFMEALEPASVPLADDLLTDAAAPGSDATMDVDSQAESPVVARAQAMIEEDDLMNVPVDDLLQDDDVPVEAADVELTGDVDLGADELGQDLDVDLDPGLKEKLDEEVDVDDELREVASLKEKIFEDAGTDGDTPEPSMDLGEEEQIAVGDLGVDSVGELTEDIMASDAVEPLAAVGEDEEFSEIDERPVGDACTTDGLSMQDDFALQGEGDVELSEATTEDVGRMTEAIRSEVSLGRKNTLEEPMPALEPPRQLPTPKMPKATVEPPREVPVKAPEAQGRLKLRMGVGEVGVVLPNGVECAIPLDFVESQGSFEMEVGEETLSVEKTDKGLLFRYGALSMTVPMLKKSAAA